MGREPFDIKRLMDRAEECRSLAGIVTDRMASESYLRVAEFYEILAEEERRLLALRRAARVVGCGL
jgi:hypothetical protein